MVSNLNFSALTVLTFNYRPILTKYLGIGLGIDFLLSLLMSKRESTPESVEVAKVIAKKIIITACWK